MTSQSLSGADLLRLEHADYRRVTLLTAWTLVWLYVLCDLLLRWGTKNGIQLLQHIDTAIPASGIWQSVIFGGGLLGIWLIYYMRDDLVEQVGERSLSYRLGNVAHARAFNIVYLCALLLAAVVALHYRLADPPFWLLFTILLISCLVNFVERRTLLRQRAAWNAMRLRLLFSQLPLIGRFVSLAPINDRLASGLPAADAADGAAPEQAPVPPAAPEDPQQTPT
jgi:1,4-dihydroxy-2-naphthoate octaprenyltransferase